MSILFDTTHAPRRERIEMLRGALTDATAPMSMHIPDTDNLSARVEAWGVGQLRLVKAYSSEGLVMTLTPRQAKTRDEPTFSIGLSMCEGGRYEQFDTQRKLPQGSLHCVDLSSTFTYGRSVGGSSFSLTSMTADQIGLPVEIIRRAAPRLPTSDLYPLVRQHAWSLTSPALAADPGAEELGEATLELCRALIASASRDIEHEREVLSETLLTRVRAYVRLNLRDPELRASTIAAAHHISVRYLFRICHEAGFSLEQWIITQRLRAARIELSNVGPQGRSIATIAKGSGFADPAHFSRRFRQEYGMTPREWRRGPETRTADD